MEGVPVTRIRLIDRLFLVGPPGVGKTEIIRQLAEREARTLGRRFVDLREADRKALEEIERSPERFYVFLRVIAPHIFPEDIALPRHVGDRVEMLPLSYWRIMSLPGIMGVLFIDEITNVKREDQLSMLFSIILEKELSYGIKLSDGIKVVAAGNPTEWSEVANPLPKPMRAGRLIRVNVKPPSIDEWAEYMNRRYGDKWDKRVYAILKAFPSMFLTVAEDDDDHIACPRSWTMLATMLVELGDDTQFLEEVVIGTVGRKAGTLVLSILRTKEDVDKLAQQFIEYPDVFKNFDASRKVLVIWRLSQMSDVQRLRKPILWLAKHDSEWLVVLLLMMPRQVRAGLIASMRNELSEFLEKLKRMIADA
ncbi:MAG: AAA family ATPase [Sulfolobales archaeon]